MAYLSNLTSGELFPLAAHHTFGRLVTSVNTYIDSPCVSKLHAAIEWNGHSWRIKNLGINGTWLNERLLEAGDTPELAINDHIRLAEQTDPGFRVLNLAPPADMLWPLDAKKSPEPVYLSRYHLLPDAQTPELAIYYDEQDKQWHLEDINNEDEQERRTLHTGSLVQTCQNRWQFMPALVVGPTEIRTNKTQKLNDFEFIFNLSLDEEVTELELLHAQQTIDLAARSHHYLMLQLARHRVQDAARGLDSKSQGWVYAEQLAAELGLDTTHMNIQIFRARKQLVDSLPDAHGHQYLLERRGGKVRFGCEKFKIFKGETLIAASPETSPDILHVLATE